MAHGDYKRTKEMVEEELGLFHKDHRIGEAEILKWGLKARDVSATKSREAREYWNI